MQGHGESRADQLAREAPLRLPGRGDSARHAAREPRANHKAADDGQKKVCELRLAQMPEIEHYGGGGADVAHHGGEVSAHRESEQEEFTMPGDTQCGARQLGYMQAWPSLRGVGLG